MFSAVLKGSVPVWGAGLAALAMAGGAWLAHPPPTQAKDLSSYAVGSLMGVVAPTSTLSRLRCIYIYGQDKKKLVAILRTDESGRFGTTLTPGTYYLDTRYPPRGASSGSFSATVEQGKTEDISLKPAR